MKNKGRNLSASFGLEPASLKRSGIPLLSLAAASEL